MPLPAGYALDTKSKGPPLGYTLDTPEDQGGGVLDHIHDFLFKPQQANAPPGAMDRFFGQGLNPVFHSLDQLSDSDTPLSTRIGNIVNSIPGVQPLKESAHALNRLIGIEPGNISDLPWDSFRAIPIAGPMLQQPSEQASSGDYSGAAGTLVQNALGLGLANAHGLRVSEPYQEYTQEVTPRPISPRPLPPPVKIAKGAVPELQSALPALPDIINKAPLPLKLKVARGIYNWGRGKLATSPEEPPQGRTWTSPLETRVMGGPHYPAVGPGDFGPSLYPPPPDVATPYEPPPPPPPSPWSGVRPLQNNLMDMQQQINAARQPPAPELITAGEDPRPPGPSTSLSFPPPPQSPFGVITDPGLQQRLMSIQQQVEAGREAQQKVSSLKNVQAFTGSAADKKALAKGGQERVQEQAGVVVTPLKGKAAIAEEPVDEAARLAALRSRFPPPPTAPFANPLESQVSAVSPVAAAQSSGLLQNLIKTVQASPDTNAEAIAEHAGGIGHTLTTNKNAAMAQHLLGKGIDADKWSALSMDEKQNWVKKINAATKKGYKPFGADFRPGGYGRPAEEGARQVEDALRVLGAQSPQ